MAAKKLVHIRRCHVCGTVNEKSGQGRVRGEPARVEQCDSCKQQLVPFFFCSERQTEGLSDLDVYRPVHLSPEGYTAIWGISTFWSDDDS